LRKGVWHSFKQFPFLIFFLLWSWNSKSDAIYLCKWPKQETSLNYLKLCHRHDWLDEAKNPNLFSIKNSFVRAAIKIVFFRLWEGPRKGRKWSLDVSDSGFPMKKETFFLSISFCLSIYFWPLSIDPHHQCKMPSRLNDRAEQ